MNRSQFVARTPPSHAAPRKIELLREIRERLIADDKAEILEDEADPEEETNDEE